MQENKESKGIRCTVCEAHAKDEETATKQGWFAAMGPHDVAAHWYCNQHNPHIYRK
jgi:hypothetical protein